MTRVLARGGASPEQRAALGAHVRRLRIMADQRREAAALARHAPGAERAVAFAARARLSSRVFVNPNSIFQHLNAPHCYPHVNDVAVSLCGALQMNAVPEPTPEACRRIHSLSRSS